MNFKINLWSFIAGTADRDERVEKEMQILEYLDNEKSFFIISKEFSVS